MALNGRQERVLEMLTRPKVMGDGQLDNDAVLAQSVDIFDFYYSSSRGGPVPAVEEIRTYLADHCGDPDGAEPVATVWKTVLLLRWFQEDNANRLFRHMNLEPRS